MKFWSAALLVSGAAASAVLDKPLVPGADANHHGRHGAATQSDAALPHRIPTSYESAVLARRILALTPLGTISTVFPHEGNALHQEHVVHDWETRPTGLGGVPVGLPEYLADCEEDDPVNAGNPSLLAIDIATTFKNARAGSNVSLTLQWEPPASPAGERVGIWKGLQKAFGSGTDTSGSAAATVISTYSPASLPRFSLLGYLEPIEGQDAPTSALARCFVRAHPDAKWWLPGDVIHKSGWERLVVTEVYWIGGFGDRAYIGWIPIEEWKAVTRAEWEHARLPGEKKGWKAWDSTYRLPHGRF